MTCTGFNMLDLAESPLNVKVENGQLVISIGINVLADAANQSDLFNPFDEDLNSWVQKWRVIDNVGWAKDIRHELLDEREDGSSPLTDLIDKMFESAMEQGSTSLWYPESE